MPMNIGFIELLIVLPITLILLLIPVFILYLLFRVHSQNSDLKRRVEQLEQIYNKRD
jgi:Na+/H+ antiporter NhaD/arsenite permease-like protein